MTARSPLVPRAELDEALAALDEGREEIAKWNEDWHALVAVLATTEAELRDLREKVDVVRALALNDYQRGLSSASEYDIGGNHTAGRILAALGEVAGRDKENNTEETS